MVSWLGNVGSRSLCRTSTGTVQAMTGGETDRIAAARTRSLLGGFLRADNSARGTRDGDIFSNNFTYTLYEKYNGILWLPIVRLHRGGNRNAGWT